MIEEISERLGDIINTHENHPTKFAMKGSLFSGMPGMFLFRLYYQRFIDQPNETLEDELVDFISEQIQAPIGTTSLCHGLTGLAWFIHHLKKHEFIDLDETLLNDFDQVVFQTGMADFEQENHDYMHGGLGNLIYLIERCETSADAEVFVKPMLEKLLAQSEKNEQGIFWKDSEVMLMEDEKGKEIVNLHLSHGQANKIFVFAKLARLGVPGSEVLLRQTVDYIRNNANKDQTNAIFPSRIVNNEKQAYEHLGWCRGNASIAVVMLMAADVLNDDSIRDEALKMARHSLQHDKRETAKVTDFAFCHGMLGLSHIYKRLYDYSQDEDFKKQAEMWMKYGMDNAVFDDGIAGFKSWDNYNGHWTIDKSLLSGMAGIGLCMLAACSSESSDWDNCFLLS